ncbi:MAG: hypothetical protein ACI8PB_004159 [Desulforhopalus sp.]|jgi:hypothetical protein
MNSRREQNHKKRCLNITNGDCAVAIMKKAGIPGDFLPWQDVLHDGPVPECSSLKELSEIRSKFIAERGWGTLSAKEMTALFQYEEPITEKHYMLANKGWSAFRSATPEKWHALLTTDTTALPFLHGAILRLLEEYPSCNNGLSRTAHQALKVILQGETDPGKIFSRSQESEDRLFMGDASFWFILNELLDSSPPLLKLAEGKSLTLPINPNQELTITPAGKAVLSGMANWLDIAEIDRWIGGVHLTPDNIWCWDADSNCCRNSH